jgi:hypothetical protein
MIVDRRWAVKFSMWTQANTWQGACAALQLAAAPTPAAVAASHLAARLPCQVLLVWRPAQVWLPVYEGRAKVHQHAHEQVALIAAQATDAHGGA